MRRKKSDTSAALVAAHKEAQTGGVGWPETVQVLPDEAEQRGALAFFAEIIEARPPSLWRKADVITAANLAIALRQQDRVTQMLETQGFLIRGNGKKGPGTGGLMASPLLAVLQQTSSRVESMSRRLGLSGVGADQRTVTNARKSFAEAGGSTFKPTVVASNDAPDWAALARSTEAGR